MTWSKRAFCPCGWSDEPSFGDVWFSQQHYPCCPSCGGSKYAYEMYTVRREAERVGTYRLLGLFERPKLEWYWVTPEGGRLVFGEKLTVLPATRSHHMAEDKNRLALKNQESDRG